MTVTVATSSIALESNGETDPPQEEGLHTEESSVQAWYLVDQSVPEGTLSYPVTLPFTSMGPGLVHGTWTGSLLLSAVSRRSVSSATGGHGGVVGVVYQYTLPTVSLVPITPVRVYDTRFSWFGGSMGNGAHRLIDIKDGIDPVTGIVSVLDVIPQGARAVSYNLTITSTSGRGYVDLLPGSSTTITGSSINWSASGQTLANGGIIALGSGANERQITICVVTSAGGSTHVILDITGYYQ